MLKIAYISTPVHFGGTEKVNLNFLKYVDRNYFEIHPIIIVRPWEEETYFAREIRSYGYDYHEIPTRKKQGKDIFRTLRVTYMIYNLMRKKSYDIVHTHGYFADICVLPVAKLMGIKTISTCHGFIFNNYKLKLYNKFDKASLRLCSRIICVSESIKKYLIKSGINEQKINVIPNGVVLNHNNIVHKINVGLTIRKKLGVSNSNFVIGYVGRLSKEKGLWPLVQSFEMLVKTRPECRLWLVGDGDLNLELEEYTQNTNIFEYIKFFGFQENVIDIMAGIDTFVLPSFTEGTPMALLEAMSLGIPSICSNVGQIPQIIVSGENGLLISPGNYEELHRAMLKIIDDKPLADHLSKNALKTVQNSYSIENWVRKIENIYSEV